MIINGECIRRDDLGSWADIFSSRSRNIFQKIANVRSETEAKIKNGAPALSLPETVSVFIWILALLIGALGKHA